MKVINRVKKHEEFQEVISKGSFVKAEMLTAYFIKNDRGLTRFGITIPTKIGHAVIRNKIKRQIRAAIALECDYKKPFDIVIIARKNYDVELFEQTKSDIKTILEKAG